jgi:hypothetical protein
VICVAQVLVAAGFLRIRSRWVDECYRQQALQFRSKTFNLLASFSAAINSTSAPIRSSLRRYIAAEILHPLLVALPVFHEDLNKPLRTTQTRPPFASITMMTAMIITVTTIVPTDIDKTFPAIRVSR